MEESPPSPPDRSYQPSSYPPSSYPPSSYPPPSYPPPPPPGAPPPAPPGGADSLPPIPWEQPGLDFFTAFYETLQLLVRSPRKAFERAAVTRALGRPLGFAILVAWPGILAGTLWDLALRQTMESRMPWLEGERFQRSPVFEIAAAILAPCWLPILLFVAAAIQHLFLMMVGGASRGFKATFRVFCYAAVSTLLGLIPACGSLVGGAWNLVLAIIGFSAVHRISTGRAILAVAMPLLLCCGCVAILLAMFGAAWMAALKPGG